MVSAGKRSDDVQRTVKAFESDITLINEQAKKLGCTAAEVILRKQSYLRETGESFDLASANKKKYAEFEAEQKAWDCTLQDGSKYRAKPVDDSWSR